MKKPNETKSTSFFAKRFAIVACLLSTLSTPAFAIDPLNPDDSTSVVAAIDKARADIVANLKSAKDQLDMLFLKAFDSVLTAQAQQPNVALQDPTGKYKFTETDEANKNTPPVPAYDLVRTAAQKSATLKLQNSLSNENAATQRQVLLQPLTSAQDAITNMLDAQNFLGPLAYSSAQIQNNAERTVAFLSDYAGPLGSIDLKKLSDKAELKDTESARKYRVKVYTNAAIRSLLLGNLYDSFNSRIPIAGLAQQSGMSNVKNASASLAEVEKYVASRRIKDPKWYETINTAPSIAVQREAVFILAEIQWQLYQLHHDNEKMLQTISATGVLNLRNSIISSDQEEIALKQEVEGTAPKKPDDIANTDTGTNQYEPQSPPPNSGVPPVPQ